MAWTGWGDNPFWNPGNLYGGINPVTGRPQDWYDTPVSMGLDVPYGEYERFLTEQGYGGFGAKAQFGRNLYNRSQSGFQAAKLTNPNLTYRDYLNTLEGGYLDQAYAGLSPQERGVFIPGQTRWIRNG
jgi:hypothetical protein